MKIGNVEIDSQLVLAPMAGVTDLGFRTICRELGAGYTVTEMVSAKALCYQDKKSIPLLKLGEGERPAAAQIFGSDPACMEEAAAIAGEVSGADIIDINMGCPVPKVANSGDGSGLMRTPDLAVRVAEAVVKGAGSRPVTVKMRLGWDKGSINCVELAKAMEIPVMANGDVFSGKDAVRILRWTGADAAMIGRGCFGNPWLFRQAQAALDGREVPPLPPLAERCETAMRQFELNAAHKGEKIACLEARKQYCWYLKGVPHAGYWKEQICHVETMEDLRRITAGIQRDLK